LHAEDGNNVSNRRSRRPAGAEVNIAGDAAAPVAK
jgi:hypothetical protein